MKNKKAVRLLLLVHGLSGFAQGIGLLSLIWYFTYVLKQSSFFGILFAGTNFISLIWGIYIGTIVDKFSRKYILLVLCATGLIVFGITGYFNAILSTFFASVLFVYTLLNIGVHNSTMMAFGQEISLSKDFRKVNALLEIAHQSAATISGLFVAILLGGSRAISNILSRFHIYVKSLSIQHILLIDGYLYLLIIIIIWVIQYEQIPDKEVGKSNIFERIRLGILFLKEHPYVFILGFFSCGAFWAITVEENLLLPLYTIHHLNMKGDIYAFAYMVFAMGAIVTGSVFIKFLKKMNSIKTIIFLMFVSSISYIGCVVAKSVFVLLLVSFILGICTAGIRIMRATYLYNNIPNHIIGRSTSVFGFINTLMATIFLLLFSIPFFVHKNHIVLTYLICSLLVLVCALPIVLKYKKIIELPYL